jgi:hypothetical protein
MIEEFHGPFPSWTQLPAATGDPNKDYTAIQNAFDTLGRSGSPVLYGQGNYHIDRELNLGIGTPTGSTRGVIGVTWLGHSRHDTGLTWVGPGPEDTGKQVVMFRHNGVTRLRFGRMFFDGGGKATIGYCDAWDNSADFFPTGIRGEDVEFRNLHTKSPLSGPQSETAGMQLGILGYGASEGSFWRMVFNQVTEHDYTFGTTTVGAMTYNFNALNNRFIDCEFVGMQYGLTCFTPASNYSGDMMAIRCSFHGIERGWIGMANVCPNGTMRWCSGRDAWRAIDGWAIGPVCPHFTLQGNVMGATSTRHVEMGNAGPVGMIDNIIGPNWESVQNDVQVIPGYNSGPGEAYGIGNSFVTQTPYAGTARVHSVDDKVGQAFTDPGLKPPPTEPPAVRRAVFEASTLGLKGAVDAAYASGEPNPVIHIQYGTHEISETVYVPGNWPHSIEGDGDSVTTVHWAGVGDGPPIYWQSPPIGIARDFHIDAKSNVAPPVDAAIIDVTGCTGGVVELDECQNGGSLQVGALRAVNTGAVIVQSVGCNWGGTPSGEYAISSEGNSDLKMLFGNCGNGNEPFYRVLDGGKLTAVNVYAENVPSNTSTFIAPGSKGTLSVDGGHVACDNVNVDFSACPELMVTISNYGFDPNKPITIKLANNLLFLGATANNGTIDPAGATRYAVLNWQTGTNYNMQAAPEMIEGVSDLDQYMRDHLALLRDAKPRDMVANVPTGQCQLQLIRVTTGNERTAFTIQGSSGDIMHTLADAQAAAYKYLNPSITVDPTSPIFKSWITHKQLNSRGPLGVPVTPETKLDDGTIIQVFSTGFVVQSTPTGTKVI